MRVNKIQKNVFLKKLTIWHKHTKIQRYAADVTVKAPAPAQALFLLSTASSEPIGSYAPMVGHGQESSSPGVPGEMMIFL